MDQSLIGSKAALLKRILNSGYTVKVIITSLLVSVIWSGLSLNQLQTEYSIRQFYPKDHILLNNDAEIRRTFQLNENSPYLFIVTQPEGQSWLMKNQIEKLQSLSQSFQENSEVAETLSLPLVEGASLQKNELRVGNIFSRVPEADWKQAILTNPLMYPLLVTADFKSTLIALEAKGSGTSEVGHFAENMKELIKKEFPRAEILSAGVPLIQSRLSKLIQTELSQFLIIAVIVFCGIFYFLFSHWTAILCAFLTLLAGNIFSLALLAVFKIPMNIVLVTLPVIVSVAMMSLLIHTLHLWSQNPLSKDVKYKNRWRGAIDTWLELLTPNLLGSWTTALGFLALVFSPIPLIHEYGWAVAGVVAIISIYSQLIILIALPWVQPRMRTWFNKPAVWSKFSLRHAKVVVLLLLIISFFGACLSAQLNFSGKLFDDLPTGDAVRASTEWMDKDYGGIVSYDLVLNSKGPDFWKDPSHLNQLSKLSLDLRAIRHVGSVVTLTDFFQTGIPQQKKEVAETFFMFSMNERNPLSQILTEDSQSLRYMIRLKDVPTLQIDQARAEIKAEILKVFPQIQLVEGGMAVGAHAINHDVAHELVYGFWQSLLVIGLFLVVMFRSLRWALVACLPNFIPPAILMGVLTMTGITVKPGVALIFSIALGFAFNNTVYLLSRLRSLMKNGKFPLKRALFMEANPCLFESFLMLIGFSIFIFSSFSMNQIFGVFMMLSIVAGFLGDLLFLPALLKIFPGLLNSTSKTIDPSAPVKNLSSGSSRKAAGYILFLLIFFSPSAQSETPKEILEKSSAHLDAHDDQARVEMKIIEKNGEIKSRVLQLKTLRDKDFYILAKIESPADIKGMAFLGQVNKKGQESQWIYLPSNGQVRRVVTGKTKAGLLGSEISPEDLSSEAIQSSDLKMAKVDADAWWIEITPAKGTSNYSKVLSQISKKDLVPINTEYYINNRLKKTVTFSQYTKMGQVWRAQNIEVKNHLNGRSTIVKFSLMKVNSGLSSKDFSQGALKED